MDTKFCMLTQWTEKNFGIVVCFNLNLTEITLKHSWPWIFFTERVHRTLFSFWLDLGAEYNCSHVSWQLCVKGEVKGGAYKNMAAYKCEQVPVVGGWVYLCWGVKGPPLTCPPGSSSCQTADWHIISGMCALQWDLANPWDVIWWRVGLFTIWGLYWHQHRHQVNCLSLCSGPCSNAFIKFSWVVLFNFIMSCNCHPLTIRRKFTVHLWLTPPVPATFHT